MMTIHKIAVYWFAGMPLWVWVLVLGLGGFNEYINRTKKTEAQTILQGMSRFMLAIPGLGSFLGKFPLVGWLLNQIATPPETEPPKKLPLPPDAVGGAA